MYDIPNLYPVTYAFSLLSDPDVLDCTLYMRITALLQWLKSLLNHEKCMRQGEFQLISVNQDRRNNRAMYSICFNIKVCCVFSLEWLIKAILMSKHNIYLIQYLIDIPHQQLWDFS